VVIVIFRLVYVLLLKLGGVLAQTRSSTYVRHILRVSLAFLW